MSTEIEVNNCFVIMTFQVRMKISTFTFVVKFMFNLQPKDFLIGLSTVIKIFNVVFRNLKCILIL